MHASQLDGLARALFEESGDALFLLDPDTDQLVDVNPLAERLTGLARAELLKLPATYLFRFGGKGGKERLRQAAGHSVAFHSQEGYFLRTARDGEWVAVNLTMARLHLKPKTLALITARDVRERHEASVRLARTEAELRRVLASVSDCLWSASIDAEGRWTYRYFSPVAERITGRPPAYFTSPAAWWAIVLPEDRLRCQAAYARLSAGSSIQEEYRIAWPDGGVHWVRDSVRASRGDTAGAPLRLDGILTDITDRKQAEEALERERYLLHALMDNLPDSIYFKDADSRFVRINQAAAAWFDLADPAEAVGKSDLDFFTAEHAGPALEDEREVMRTGQLLLGKEELETWPDGRRTWVLSSKLPLRDAGGNIVGTFGISRDITRRKEAEADMRELLGREQSARRELETAIASLRASEARFLRLFESNIIGLVIANFKGTLIDANDAFLQMIGYSRAELPLRLNGPLTPPEYRAVDRRAAAQLRATGVSAPWEKEYVRKDGSRVPVLLGAVLLQDTQEDCICFVLDMSERNRMRTLVAQSEKLASIGLLSAGIAHEINNPLAYVGNNLTVLEQGVGEVLALLDIYEAARERLAVADPAAAERVRELAEKIDLPYVRTNLGRLLARSAEGVRRITRIVQSLRGLARTDPGEMEDASATDLIEMSLEVVRGRMKQSRIAADVSCEPGLRLRCSATGISQVLLNLLVNAVQAVESAGRGDEGRVRLAARRSGTFIVFEVADNGTGIDPNDLPRLFDPFFTRKPVGEGTGLGLTISHNIVEGHGGRIEVESPPGEGTCFRVLLPEQPGAMAGGRPKA
jgi:PAS domain S-box-containing protein